MTATTRANAFKSLEYLLTRPKALEDACVFVEAISYDAATQLLTVRFASC